MTRKTTILSFVISLVILSGLGFIFNSQAAPEINQAAVDYLKTKDNSAWKTMALVAAGETGLTGNHLKDISSNNAIDYCAPTLAITALGENPRTYPNQDYVVKLKSFWDGAQLGDASTLNDDIFGLLALISSGEATAEPIITGIKEFLIATQNSNGGWGFSVGGDSDTNMTAMAIMALVEAGLAPSDLPITKAVAYLVSSQNDDGGFPWSPASPWGTDSDASSDAWVISAIYALGQNPGDWIKNDHNPIEHLKSLQAAQGYFEYQTGTGEDAFSPVTTSYAVIALAGKSYPVNKITYTPSETFDLRIEGQSSTICSGRFPGPTALNIIENASEICGFTYEIKATDYGPYLKKINDEEAGGLMGWLYFVNCTSPLVGAADYILQQADEVLWYFGEWGWPPLKIGVSAEEAASGGTIEAIVEYYDTEWHPLENATVKAGNHEFTTDASGSASVSLADGYYNLYAEKAAFVRSNKIRVKFGEPTSDEVSLQVNIIEGEKPGTGLGPGLGPDEISFLVEPEEIIFGDLAPGQSASQNVTITNTGAVDLYLEGIVSGGDIFQDNLTLNDTAWENWGTNIAASNQKETAVQLNIPGNYSVYGEQTGNLTFWGITE